MARVFIDPRSVENLPWELKLLYAVVQQARRDERAGCRHAAEFLEEVREDFRPERTLHRSIKVMK